MYDIPRKRILITGANGQLGNEMRVMANANTQHQCTFTDVAELDITNLDAIRQFLKENPVDYLFNCAAYTNVDKAEDDEEKAYILNAIAPQNLGIATAEAGVKLVHISTDYVFSGNGNTPYRESDPTDPQSAYGRTKLAGEKLLTEANPDAIIIRTAWLYSEYGKNFVKTMIALNDDENREEIRVIFDQIGSPTFALDLAAAIFGLVNSQQWVSGVYHYTNEGVCSWYDLAYTTINQIHGDTSVLPIRSEEYPSKVARPKYSVLDKTKFKQTFNADIPHWTDGLKRCLKSLGYYAF